MTEWHDIPRWPPCPSGDCMLPVEQLVDQFVAVVNASYREPVNVEADGTPPSVLVGNPDGDGWCDWAIRPYAGISWVEPLQQRLGRNFPAVFRSLVTRYIFPSFEVDGVFFFANTPEGTEFRELRARIFSQDLFSALKRSGCLQIGQLAGGGYDPVCLALDYGDGTDCPLVQIDHEDVLMHGVVTVVRRIAPSLCHLMGSAVEGTGSRPTVE